MPQGGNAAARQNERRWREMWADEIAGAALYRALAGASRGERRGIFERLAEAEERHAAHWAGLLTQAGVTELRAPRIPFRVRALGTLARRFGSGAVLPFVLRLEAADTAKYAAEPDAAPGMSSQEKAHGLVVASLTGATAGGGIVRAEGRHRTAAGGALRAGVFGVNDGLVSNLSLVMGVAGGTAPNSKLVLLAGIAGLLAGAFSMAAGEWVSVRSQRELHEREIGIEREELAAFPEEEREELALIFQAKGIDEAQARALADQMMSKPETALDTLVREELGLDPSELVSPWVAAVTSFLAFAVGALIPVVPYLIGSGGAALAWASGLSGLSLFAVGASISVFTGRGAMRSGARMVAIGAAAAALTFGIGRLIGVSVS